jgi:hypothetical protein
MLARSRLTPQQRKAEIDRRKARQRELTLAKLSPEQRAEFLAAEAEAAKRPRAEVRAEALLRQKAVLEERLAAPDIAAVLPKVEAALAAEAAVDSEDVTDKP